MGSSCRTMALHLSRRRPPRFRRLSRGLVPGEHLLELVQRDVAGDAYAGGVLSAEPSAQQPHHGLRRTLERGRRIVDLAGHGDGVGDLDAAARDGETDLAIDL